MSVFFKYHNLFSKNKVFCFHRLLRAFRSSLLSILTHLTMMNFSSCTTLNLNKTKLSFRKVKRIVSNLKGALGEPFMI